MLYTRALLLAGGLAGALATVPATAASLATDTVMLCEAEFNLRTDQLTVVAAGTGTSAVLTVSVATTGPVISTLTSYYSAAGPADAQAGVFKVIVCGQVTHPAEITVGQQRGRPGQHGGQLVPARRLLTSPRRPGGLDRRQPAPWRPHPR